MRVLIAIPPLMRKPKVLVAVSWHADTFFRSCIGGWMGCALGGQSVQRVSDSPDVKCKKFRFLRPFDRYIALASSEEREEPYEY